MKKIEVTAKSLAEILVSAIGKIEKGEITPQAANAICNCTGKIISLVRLELAFTMRGNENAVSKILQLT